MTYQLPGNIQVIVGDSVAKSKSIVLVTGVFDVLHFEHENFLNKASELGDFLIVAVESDFRVRQIKGKGRPVNSQKKRVRKIVSLDVADGVFVLPDEFNNPQNHIDLIKAIGPAILAVSSHTAHLDQKRKIMGDVGGKLVVVHDHNPDVSSTKMIEGLG